VVKLHFFAGLTMPEVAQSLDLSLATAERYWTYARTWLYAELAGYAVGLLLRLRVGRRVLRPGPDARATVYPCGTACGPKHLLPCTPPGVRHAEARAHPSNERCLRRFTRRHNGGSSRQLLA
jgi:hypothetical protein